MRISGGSADRARASPTPTFSCGLNPRFPSLLDIYFPAHVVGSAEPANTGTRPWWSPGHLCSLSLPDRRGREPKLASQRGEPLEVPCRGGLPGAGLGQGAASAPDPGHGECTRMRKRPCCSCRRKSLQLAMRRAAQPVRRRSDGRSGLVWCQVPVLRLNSRT